MIGVEELREFKRRNGYTDQQIGEKTGYSRVYVNQVLNGALPISPAFSLRVGRAFSLSSGDGNRVAVVNRETGETNISLELNIDGSGQWKIDTGIQMFDHLLSQVVRHGRFDLELNATGDDPHHLIEDIAICLGKALSQALAGKEGIIRMADATVPMDEALATVALDISGRAYTVLELSFSGNDMAGFPSDLIRHFLESFAIEARLNLHARIVYGVNDHHRAEALFKALGRALDMATRIDERMAGGIPSTKELLEG